jgi:hypothetical protein
VPALSLAAFDGKLLDGLEFCRKVYRFHDQVINEADGISKLRLRSRRENILLRELIPIACYVQARYKAGCLIKVRWCGKMPSARQKKWGDGAPCDAILLLSGGMVEQRLYPSKLVVEVTCSVPKSANGQPTEHLRRELLANGEVAWNGPDISRNRQTGKVEATAYAYSGREHEVAFSQQLLADVKRKCAKKYPAGRVLIVDCVPNGLLLAEEWGRAVQAVSPELVREFREVFLSDHLHFATIRGADFRD